ncbi:hypothetical protein BGX30_000326 [Mortierella sp. GBA39]|nr:hypothetical protein BGX30_000326 [Mortierella sp. GBA39]
MQHPIDALLTAERYGNFGLAFHSFAAAILHHEPSIHKRPDADILAPGMKHERFYPRIAALMVLGHEQPRPDGGVQYFKAVQNFRQHGFDADLIMHPLHDLEQDGPAVGFPFRAFLYLQNVRYEGELKAFVQAGTIVKRHRGNGVPGSFIQQACGNSADQKAHQRMVPARKDRNNRRDPGASAIRRVIRMAPDLFPGLQAAADLSRQTAERKAS